MFLCHCPQLSRSMIRWLSGIEANSYQIAMPRLRSANDKKYERD